MPRNAFAQISKISSSSGRIDYISNPERQEHLFTTYSTTNDDSFWEELATVCREEHDKYGAGGKVIEAREWIIALDESLLELNPDMVIRKFVDAFHEKYGVECTAALHHNSEQTNYHIHMIFSERQLLPEPIEKIATRNMFFDENGKHKRTKKEILDADGNIRPGCKVIAKGEVYDRQKFSGKDPQFKTVAFRKEAQELFKDINNSLITDENRKLSIFNPDDVYLATKKVGKNNPMADFIIADNEERKEWNMSVDQALIALVDRDDILAVKHESIQNEVRKSIAENGNAPGMFAGIVKKAVAKVKDMMMKACEKIEEVTAPRYEVEYVYVEPQKSEPEKPKYIPPKPQKPSEVEKFKDIQSIHNQIKKYYAKIKTNEGTIEALESAIKTCTPILGFFEKRDYQNRIKKLKEENANAHACEEHIVKRYGYTTVDAFMQVYRATKKVKDSYERKLADWNNKYGQYDESEAKPRRSIKESLKENKKKVEESKKKTKSKSRNSKYSERD